LTDTVHSSRQRYGQFAAAIAVTLEKMQHHALSSFAAHTGQTAKRVNQLLDKW
jgi:hypothetical protein